VAAALRVLLVDDSAEFVEGVRALLDPDERLDVVGAAADGEEAVALAERLRPDLVLMDIGLPRVDGVEATRAIRERCPTARVVMLTGRHERADELGSGDAGAVGFLHKEQLGSPRLADELLALVELS
jgi:NarL family two-component system response regulator LiaR